MNTQLKPRILFIDDDETILKSIERLLSRDFQVTLASSIRDAAKVLKESEFAIVVADQKLPDGKGLDLLSDLAKSKPDSVRVLVTGSLNLEELSKSINSGIIHRLVIKPWDNEYLRVQMLEALQNHALLREKTALARLAITDPITSLNNHRFFQDTLRTEQQRATRHNRPLAVLMLDIDHFKNFNDRFGHPAGDRLLADLSKRILNNVRTLDMVARYGGEEFVVLMPDTAGSDALRVAERIRIAIESQVFDVFHSPDQAKITVSVGVASLKPNSNIVEEADQALYQAKNSGRNRSVLAE